MSIIFVNGLVDVFSIDMVSRLDLFQETPNYMSDLLLILASPRLH